MTNDKTNAPQELIVHNHGSSVVELWIEPWGDMVPMSAGTALRVVVSGRSSGCLEVAIHDGRLSVYGWSGSVLKIFDHNEHELWSTSIECP